MKPNISILIVDDNDEYRQLLVMMLHNQMKDIAIFESDSSAGALEILKKEKVDIILLDYYLPATKGLELLDKLTTEEPDIKVIVITGLGDERLAADAIKRGADDYLNKDYITPEILAATILNSLKRLRFEKESMELKRKIEIDRKRYQSIFEQAREVIFVSDMNLVITDINPYGVNLFGYDSKSEMTGLNIKSLIDENHLGEFENNLSKESYHATHEILFNRKDGEKIYGLISITTLEDETSTTKGYQGIIHDITQRKLMEEEILQLQKLETIGKYTGTITHDFNNIIAAITVNAEMVSRKIPADSVAQEYLELIKISAKKAEELTQRLLGLSQKQPITFKKVDIIAVLSEIDRLTARLSEKKNFKLTLKNTDRNYFARGNSVELSQLFLNLITNSIDAVSEGGQIKIKVEEKELLENKISIKHPLKPGNYVIVTISDNGTGIDPDIQTKVYDPFFTTKKDKKVNLGLGLTSAMLITKRHDGHIAFKSDTNKGTEFYIYLPKFEDQEEQG